MSHRALLAAAGALGKACVEDVFSASIYTGNGATQTISNGIDLTKGGLVWSKWRSGAFGSMNGALVDTVCGNAKFLNTESAGAQNSQTLLSFNSNGYTLPDAGGGYTNSSGANYVGWTFRRAPKFFDVVTWTGDGTGNRQIPHALGIAPGMVTAKRRDSTGPWAVWHRSATGDLYLEQTAAQTASFTQVTGTSATTFSVSGNANLSGATYVAYVWAHDPDTANGIVQCGTFTTDASGLATVTLGWEPQFTLVKGATGTSTFWILQDSARGSVATGNGNSVLYANSNTNEATGQAGLHPNSTGFTIDGGGAGLAASTTYIYLAIRRGPMRTPTSGASVYNAVTNVGQSAPVSLTGAGFPPDLLISYVRFNGGAAPGIFDRLRGIYKCLSPGSPSGESTAADSVTSFDQNGCTFGADSALQQVNSNSYLYIDWLFRRAPGVFDIVCYAGTGATQAYAHSLGVAPKLVITKARSTTQDWYTYHASLGPNNYVVLNTGAAQAASSGIFGTGPTSTQFSIGGGGGVNYVAYLFGEVAGVSKIGSYTGNGATQTINCGFTNGVRFLLIKRTDATGDWLVLNSLSGIVVGNDPYGALDWPQGSQNSTTDLLTPQSVGFGLTSNALVNTNGGTYIFLAIA
ncbi:hypothetical protein [Paraburkholderia sp. DGU8]|uniref:DUF7483 domain-containing protein n=1 Tax=Paraburkholderia sp. DGU8 TaxID=3161997 RepID=UPI003466FCFB